MQLVEGATLEHSWPDLDIEDRWEICQQLQLIFEALRQLNQDPNDLFIGNISRGSLPDIIFECQQPAGPFNDVKHFHDCFATLNHLGPNAFLGPFRSGLLDDIPVIFAHSDLNRGNIMMRRDAEEIPRITGIIDWHESGWYPASWEFYKTRWTASKGNDQWELEFVLEFLQAYRGYMSWEYFVHSLGY